jgi:hypothetical protein
VVGVVNAAWGFVVVAEASVADGDDMDVKRYRNRVGSDVGMQKREEKTRSKKKTLGISLSIGESSQHKRRREGVCL